MRNPFTFVQKVDTTIWVLICSVLILGGFVLLLFFGNDFFFPLIAAKHSLYIYICLGSLIAFAILEVVAARTKKLWLFGPYIIGFSIFAISQFVFICYVVLHSGSYLVSLGNAALFTLMVVFDVGTFVLVSVVVRSILALIRERRHVSLVDEDGRPLFEDLERGHALKPTIVSKLLHDYDYTNK